MHLRDLVVETIGNPARDQVFNWIGHLASDGAVADLLYRRFDRFAGVIAVGRQENEPVAICGWEQDEGIARIGPLVVREDKRRWGAAGHLVDRAIDALREEGVRTIEAEYVEGDTACMRLFDRRGFRRVGGESGTDGVQWTRVERLLKKTGKR